MDYSLRTMAARLLLSMLVLLCSYSTNGVSGSGWLTNEMDGNEPRTFGPSLMDAIFMYMDSLFGKGGVESNIMREMFNLLDDEIMVFDSQVGFAG